MADIDCGYFNLGKLIEFLEKQPTAKVAPVGFCNPHSYRGFYEDLAFEPAENVNAGEMLACAKLALGKTFQGCKGGDFTMRESTDCWIAYQGSSCGQQIGSILMNYMFGLYK